MKTSKSLALISLLPLVPVSSAVAAALAADEEPRSTVVVVGDYEIEPVPTNVASVGPLGSTPVLDQPYSIGILPSAMIQNSQAVNFKDVSKYLPLVAYQEQQGPDILRPQTRGMQGGNFQNSKFDGMTMFVTVAQAMEQYQQIEVVNGPSSSLYGPANPSGMFNFISKRPTQTALHELSASYVSDSIGTAKVDFGGPIDSNGIFGYRLNALYGSGDGYVDRSHQRRILGDLGVDIHPWEHGVFELNYSDYSLQDKGYPGWFTYGETIQLPPAPDPNRVGYGQSYAGIELRTRMGSARFKQDLGSDWHLVVGVLNQDASRNINTPTNNLTNSAGAYTASFANGFAPRFAIVSDVAYLNGTFSTWGLGHDLTVGTSGYKARSFAVLNAASAASVRLGTATIDNPQVFPEPAAGPPNVLANYDSSDTYQQGLNLNDEIKLTDHWLVRGGISQDWFTVKNYNTQRVQTTEYTNHGVSPSASVIFKPVSNQSVYVTYVSSLQAGDLAPGTAANAGVSLAPYRSKEYEIGYKIKLERLDLSAAAFRVERPFANTDTVDRIFKISGDQVNKGIEASAVGQVFNGLTVYGGLTWLNARLEHTPLVTTNDKAYVGAAKIKGNVLFEYAIPTIEGLVATFNYQFSGDRAANDTNTLTAPGYNLFDLGGRYTQHLANTQLTYRLAMNNITNRAYWSTIAPSNLTGTNTGNLLAHLGSPRMVLASVTADF